MPAKILIVDDDPSMCLMIENILFTEGYQLQFVDNGPEALNEARAWEPDVILSDVMMPGMDGFELCRQLRATPLLQQVPLIFITSLDDQDSRLQGLESGADDFISKPFNSFELRARLRTLTRLNRYRLLTDQQHALEQAHRELLDAYDATIEGWSRALDLRDKETEGHSQRVMAMTIVLARAFNINDNDLVYIRWGALLHDIGKMGIPDTVLLKPTPLNDEEWVKMRQHPTYAYHMLEPIKFLHQALDIPYCHHEKWDGSGYPRGLKGKEIPLAARLFAIADVWDALTSDRPYRPALDPSQALEYIRSQGGRHFDPEVVDLFLDKLVFADDSAHHPDTASTPIPPEGVLAPVRVWLSEA